MGSDRKPRPPGSEQPISPEARGERRLISPFRCRVWTQHSRPEEQLTEQACRTLRESIARNGQHQPALGRPVANDPDYDVEVICGARRLCAARALGHPLLIEVRHMTDADAYIAMYEENLLREEDSPYVRGQILWRALRSGTYPSQEELGRAFALSHSAVSRLLMLAQLPSIVVAAFQCPHDIREAWGVELFRLCSEDARRHDVAVRARAIANRAPRPSPRQIFGALITPTGGKSIPIRAYRNVPIRGSSGNTLFHEQDQISRLIYIIPKASLSPNRRKALQQLLSQFLENESATPHS